MNLQVLVEERKRYSRSYFGFGRIRILFDKKIGQETSQFGRIKTKKQLTFAIAQLLPDIQKENALQIQNQLKSAGQDEKLTLLNFPFGNDPMVHHVLRYEYGAIPVLSETKTNETSSKKKGKKKK